MDMDVVNIIANHPEYIVEVEHKRWYLSKSESWYLMTKGDAYRVSQFVAGIEPDQPDTKGGFTSIKVFTPYGVKKAISRCSDHDVYCKKTGRINCIEKLIKQGLKV